jgi:hypothetical protein
MVSTAQSYATFSISSTEVSLTNPVLTPGHGVWTLVGHRQFTITIVAVLYDIQTGEYRGAGKLRALLTLDKAGNLTGAKKAEFFDPDGNLVGTLVGELRFTRIKVEPFDYSRDSLGLSPRALVAQAF